MTSQKDTGSNSGYETPEDWALENAARMAELTARNGVDLTWAEAHRALLANNALVEAPAYAPTGDAGQYEEIPTLPGALIGWRDPTFVEAVACGRVHFEGKIYVPINPSTSKITVAIPWSLAGELTSRLAFILGCSAKGQLDGIDQVEVTTLLANLTFSVSRELHFSAEGEEEGYLPDAEGPDYDPGDDWAGGESTERPRDMVEGRCYLLMRCCDVHRAAAVIAQAKSSLTAAAADVTENDASTRTASGEATLDLEPQLPQLMSDPDLCDEFLWGLDHWISPAA